MKVAIHDWVGAYALGTLEPEEMREFDRHLVLCADCRAELASLSGVIEALGDNSATEPPASLHERVSGAIAGVPQEPPTLAAARARRASGRRPALRPGMLGVAAALLIGLAVVVANLWPASLTAEQQQLAAVVDAPDARVLELGVGEAHLVVSDEAGGYAAVGSVPGLEPGRAYQLWLVTGDGAVNPGPTFSPGEDGTVGAAALADLTGVVAVAVSVEPEGGSLQPTTDPIALVEL